jgi:hypothetical protein
VARDYIERHGNVRGALWKPVIAMHTTIDGIADTRHASAYRKTVEFWGAQGNLLQVFAPVHGHNGFTARQLLTGLSAMENWLDTGRKPAAASAFPESLGFDNNFVPPPWPFY